MVNVVLALLHLLFTLSAPPPTFYPEPISLERIFSPDHSWTATISAQKKVTLVTTGDVLLARTINASAVTKNDFAFPYEFTSDLLSTSDITFINLETPLHKDCPVKTTGTVFCGHQRHAAALRSAGVDIANLANNHATDTFGPPAPAATAQILNSASILTTGLSSPVYTTSRGVRFAFLGYNDVCCPSSSVPGTTSVKIQAEIAQARPHTDVLVVQFHWGTEYTHQVSARQRQLARLAIDTGADIVVGNHPHWVQPLEIYKNKPILYSHGNFVFDQYWSTKTRQGAVAKFTFYGPQLADIELVPIYINLSGQPQVASDETAAAILSDIRRQSVE